MRATPGAADFPAGRAMLDDPERALQVLADVTERAWRALIAADWPRLRSVLEADIACRSADAALLLDPSVTDVLVNAGQFWIALRGSPGRV